MTENATRRRRLLWWGIGYLIVVCLVWGLELKVAERWWFTTLLTYLPQQPALLPGVVLLPWALARRALPITIVNSLKLGLLVGIFIPVPLISLASLVLLLSLATYYGRWAMLTRDWRTPLIPFAVAVMFSVYALSMVRAFIRGRQTFNYSKRPKK